jgi:hypothetical protein
VGRLPRGAPSLSGASEGRLLGLLPPAPPYRRLAAETDSSRDRVIDTVRAFSLGVVVLGHSFMAVIAWRDGVPIISNVLSSSEALRALTWMLQVMPLFFFAGGAANAISWRRHRNRGYGPWLWSRTARLLRPLWIYLAVMVPVAMLIDAVTPEAVSGPLLLVTTQLLWFLGVYLAVTALAPALLAGHRHHRMITLLLLIAVSVSIDIARFGFGVGTEIALINFITVWSVAAHLGAWYVDGFLRGRAALVLAVVALGANIALVAAGPYPVSMVPLPDEAITNVVPPTVALLLHVVWLCALCAAAAPLIDRAAAHVSVWRLAVVVNIAAMTIYLWHIPVLILISVLQRVLGLTAPVTIRDNLVVPVSGYGMWTAAHTVIFVLATVGVVRVLWITENGTLPLWDSRTRVPALPTWLQTVTASTGAFLCGVALLMVATTGLAGFPTRIVTFDGIPLSSGLALLVLLFGAALVRTAGAERR